MKIKCRNVLHQLNILKKFNVTLMLAFTLALSILLSNEIVYAACGGTVRTWDAGDGSDKWNTNSNWNPNNSPNTTTEDAVIASAAKDTALESSISIGCMEVQSGLFVGKNGRTLTINGDYFRATTIGTVDVDGMDDFWINMAGSSAQTFEMVDPHTNLRISNDSTVTLTEPFTINNDLDINTSTGVLYIDADLTIGVESNTAVTIPQGATVELRSGANLTMNRDMIVNGSLVIGAGSSILFADGYSITVSSTGSIDLDGASGNIASITAIGSGDMYSFSMAGLMNANYFRVDRMDVVGLNITGTLQTMSNGEFHFIANSGYAMTLGSAASMPSTLNTLGFYDDDGHGNTQSFDASSYDVSDITVNNWSGGAGGASNENDPNSRVTWGTQAGVELILSDNTESGFPSAETNQGSTDELFTTFSFSLNQAGSSTDITSITITQTGTGSASDVAAVRLYLDDPAEQACVYDTGKDDQVDTDKVMSGAPATATFTLGAGDLSTASDSDIVCIHVVVDLSESAQDAKTLQFAISNTGDVTNSQAYGFSAAAGPPVSGGSTSIKGDAVRSWQGDVDTLFSQKNNWDGGLPNSTKDCNIGSGINVCEINTAASACQNATLLTGGTMDFASTTNEFASYSNFEIQSSFTFNNATSGVLAFRGTSGQSMNFASNFPGDLLVNNTGTSPNDVVSVANSTQIGGNVTISNGVLNITNGVTLTVLGDITIASGATLDIDAGGTLILAEGSTITANGTFTAVGSSGQNATITSNGAGNGYNIVINGTINAQYYNFDHLGTGGLSIESGATISGTYKLDNGSFTYPADSSMTMLSLKQQVPTDAIDSISFASNGSSATSVTNIDTTGASAGTLSITNYSGDLSGLSYDTDPSYVISWSGATNTIDITQEEAGPVGVDAGSTYYMGRYGFQQSQAGASFNDANVTSLKVTLLGTGTASDVDQVRLYEDNNCDGAFGVLIGSGTFSGNPASSTIAITSGDFVVEADVSSPPLNCIYVEYDIASGASNSKTVGIKIQASTDFVNDQNYLPSGSTTFPVTLGSAATIAGASDTVWTGATSTDWFTASNWSAGLPDATKNCVINNLANDPNINGGTGTAVCKNATIGSGIVTFQNGTSAILELHGSINHTGTFNWFDGSLEFNDSGTGANQSITTNQALPSLRINKTGGGSVSMLSTGVNVTTLTYVSGNTGEFKVPSGRALIMLSSLSIPNGTFTVEGGAELRMPNASTITVNGGTFRTTGVEDSYPQNESQKGKVTINGSGTWGFTATSGTVALNGFILDYIDTNGLNIGGTATLSDLDSGLFTNLSESYASVKVMQLNSSNIPSVSDNVEWNWGPNNTPPDSADAYLIGSSTGCGSNVITFNNWWGDFTIDELTQDPDMDTKISESSCDIVISYANSPVTLTSFDAVGFDDEVLVTWTTGNEWEHEGFNVYRSTDPTQGFLQINSELVRNLYGSLGPIGQYRFVDNNVSNGQVYYYMIEDVAATGAVKKHGPVYAMPFAGLGNVPTLPDDTNEGGNEGDDSDSGNGVTPGPIENPGLVDLGNGVHILAQSNDSIRLEIIPPAAVYSTSLWNASYEEVTVPGYSKSLVAGHPELPERIILLEVDSSFTSVEVSNAEVTEGSTVSHNIQPAPSYAPDGDGNLQPAYAIDSAIYSTNAFSNNDYFSVDTTLAVVGEKKFIKIIVKPLKFNPVTENVNDVAKIVLDLGLDGQAWQIDPPSADLAHAPSAIEGAVRMKYQQEGMYEVSFDELAVLGVEGYVAGLDIDELRGYFLGREIPLDINSADGLFNSGDTIRFWGDVIPSIHSNLQEVVLAPVDVQNSGAPALRYQELDGDPTGFSNNSDNLTDAKKKFEQDLLHLTDRKLGDLEDHFFWARLGKWNATGKPEHYPQFETFNLDLSGLDSDQNEIVRLVVYARGRTQYTLNATHHLGVWVNNVPFRVADKTFDDYYKTRLVFEVPASYFIDGVNNLQLEVMPDTVPVGDWALIDIDRIEVEYKSNMIASSNQHLLYKANYDEVYNIENFTENSIKIYDISDSEQAVVLNNLDIFTLDVGLTYNVRFHLPSSAGDETGYRLVAISDSATLSPVKVFLAGGVDQALKITSRQADMLVIGSVEMLAAAEELIDHRQAQGLNVQSVSLDQIYSEFSNGVDSVEGIREFLRFAFENWQSPKIRYVLFAGDATYDPKDHLGLQNGESLMPAVQLSGDFFDFASDSWFVAFNDDMTPEVAVGRIPASNTLEMRDYVSKVLDYENGVNSPSPSHAKSFEFYADLDTYWEGFEKKTAALASTVSSANADIHTVEKALRMYDDEAHMKTDILSTFNDSSPLVMALVGHGTNEMWGESILTNTDAAALANEKLPIVLGLNCSTGYYHDADPSFKSLSESLVLNKTGGAIAYWGSTAYTVPEAQVSLTNAMFEEMAKELKFGNQQIRLGDLLLRAKRAHAHIASSKDTLRSWVLIGDPAMKLPEAAFTEPQTVAPPPAPTEQNSGGRSGGGGGGGCGTIGPIPPGNGPGPGPFMFLLVLPLLLAGILRKLSQSAI